VEAQSLATKGTVGYVVTDVSAEVGPDVLDEVAALPDSIRLRQIS
jgi:D-3-phosphoglycerate dehydrogenase